MTSSQLIHSSAEISTQARTAMKALILSKFAAGISYHKLYKEDDTYPKYETILHCAENDETFSAALARARMAGGFRSADKANDFVDELLDVPDVRLIDTKAIASILLHLRWNAERTARPTYGNQIDVKHSGTVNIRTSFLIPRSKQSVEDGDIIDIDATMLPAALGDAVISGGVENWMG